MELIVKSILILSFLAFFSLSSFARKPAIEPVRGISIDHYKEVKPSQDPGFNFNSTTERAPSNKVTNTKTYRTTSSDANHTPSNTLPGVFFLITLAAMPFGLWWLVVNHKDEETHTVQSTPSNTYDFMKEKENRTTHNDDDDIKKAS